MWLQNHIPKTKLANKKLKTKRKEITKTNRLKKATYFGQSKDMKVLTTIVKGKMGNKRKMECSGSGSGSGCGSGSGSDRSSSSSWADNIEVIDRVNICRRLGHARWRWPAMTANLVTKRDIGVVIKTSRRKLIVQLTWKKTFKVDKKTAPTSNFTYT